MGFEDNIVLRVLWIYPRTKLVYVPGFEGIRGNGEGGLEGTVGKAIVEVFLFHPVGIIHWMSENRARWFASLLVYLVNNEVHTLTLYLGVARAIISSTGHSNLGIDGRVHSGNAHVQLRCFTLRGKLNIQVFSQSVVCQRSVGIDDLGSDAIAAACIQTCRIGKRSFKEAALRELLGRNFHR